MTFVASSPGRALPAGRDDAQGAGVVAVDDLGRQLEDALQHHRHDDEAAALELGGRAQGALGVEAPAQHDRGGQADRQHPVRVAPRVEDRRRDVRVLSRAVAGCGRAARATGSSDSGCLRLAPFGEPVVPDVRITMRPFSAGGTTSEASPPAMRSSSSWSACLASSPSVQATKRLRRRPASATSVGELLVVDDRLRLLALADLGDLRPREHRVEVERVGAELRAGDRRVDEAAVVAAEDGDVVALADAAVRERVGEARSCAGGPRRRSACRARRRSPGRRGSGSPTPCSRRRASGPSAGARAPVRDERSGRVGRTRRPRPASWPSAACGWRIEDVHLTRAGSSVICADRGPRAVCPPR